MQFDWSNFAGELHIVNKNLSAKVKTQNKQTKIKKCLSYPSEYSVKSKMLAEICHITNFYVILKRDKNLRQFPVLSTTISCNM